MFLFVIFLIGLVLPFILIKVEFSWIIWIPAMIFFLAAILAVVKSVIFPGEGMLDLAERIYVMIFGTAAIGSIVGGGIAHFIKSKK